MSNMTLPAWQHAPWFLSDSRQRRMRAIARHKSYGVDFLNCIRSSMLILSTIEREHAKS